MKKREKKEKTKAPFSKKKIKILLVIVALFALVGAACYTVFIVPLLEEEQWVYKEATVEKGTLKVGVSESGSLEYGISSILYDLDLDVSDENEEDDEEELIQKYLKVEEVYVTSGQRITQGEALLKFTQDSITDVKQLLNMALVDAKTEYNEAEAEYNLSALEAQTEYEIQKVSANYAFSIYQNTIAGVDNDITSIEVQIAQKTANTTLLEERLTEAQEIYQEAQAEYEEAKEGMDTIGVDNTVNFMYYQNTYLNAQTKYENAKTSLKQAQQNLEDNTSQIASLQKDLEAAQAAKSIEKLTAKETYQENLTSGETAEITYSAQIENLKETLEEAQEAKEKIEKQMQAFEAFVGEDGILYAEYSGIVTELNYQAGDSLINTGAILSYATPESMTISVDVTQEDIVSLSVGDKVDITFTAYEDVTYEGIIQSIDTTAIAQNTNTVSYTVVISVQGDTELLYGGMTADIIFVTEQKEDILYVSRKAIVQENGKSYVYVENALGEKELKEVETGISNSVSIEIVSGLEEGETIYLASRVSSEEEVKNSDIESDTETSTNTQMPEGMELPEGMEIPEGVELPNGIEMPEGMELPNGMEMPDGMQMPNGQSGGFGGRGGDSAPAGGMP